MGPVKYRAIIIKTVSKINKGQSEVPFLKVTRVLNWRWVLSFRVNNLSWISLICAYQIRAYIKHIENMKDVLINVGVSTHNSRDNRMHLSLWNNTNMKTVTFLLLPVWLWSLLGAGRYVLQHYLDLVCMFTVPIKVLWRVWLDLKRFPAFLAKLPEAIHLFSCCIHLSGPLVVWKQASGALGVPRVGGISCSRRVNLVWSGSACLSSDLGCRSVGSAEEPKTSTRHIGTF